MSHGDGRCRNSPPRRGLRRSERKGRTSGLGVRLSRPFCAGGALNSSQKTNADQTKQNTGLRELEQNVRRLSESLCCLTGEFNSAIEPCGHGTCDGRRQRQGLVAMVGVRTHAAKIMQCGNGNMACSNWRIEQPAGTNITSHGLSDRRSLHSESKLRLSCSEREHCAGHCSVGSLPDKLH